MMNREGRRDRNRIEEDHRVATAELNLGQTVVAVVVVVVVVAHRCSCDRAHLSWAVTLMRREHSLCLSLQSSHWFGHLKSGVGWKRNHVSVMRDIAHVVVVVVVMVVAAAVVEENRPISVQELWIVAVAVAEIDVVVVAVVAVCLCLSFRIEIRLSKWGVWSFVLRSVKSRAPLHL